MQDSEILKLQKNRIFDAKESTFLENKRTSIFCFNKLWGFRLPNIYKK